MSRVHLFVALSLVVLMLTAAAIASAAGPVSVTLTAMNDSGENGTATLTDLGNGKVKVEVTVTGAPAGVPQPLHIHNGTCATLDPKPVYPLTNAVDGKSVTEIEASFTDLQNGKFAINGHKSGPEAKIYVFCGNIPALAAALPTTGADFTNGIMLLALLGLAIVAAGFIVMRVAPRAR